MRLRICSKSAHGTATSAITRRLRTVEFQKSMPGSKFTLRSRFLLSPIGYPQSGPLEVQVRATIPVCSAHSKESEITIILEIRAKAQRPFRTLFIHPLQEPFTAFGGDGMRATWRGFSPIPRRRPAATLSACRRIDAENPAGIG